MKGLRTTKWRARSLPVATLAAAVALSSAWVASPVAADEIGWVHLKRASVGVVESQLGDCAQRAARQGNGVGSIIGQCFDSFFELAPPVASRRSVDGEIYVAGYRSALVARTLRHDRAAAVLGTPLYSENFIGGSNTRLHAIRAVSLDTVDNEVAALDSSGEILFFSAPFDGNVYPIRVIRLDSPGDAAAIAIDAAAGEVAVARGSGSIQFFARGAAQPGAAPGSARTAPARTIRGGSTQLVSPASVAVAPNHRETIVADPVANQILVFDSSAQGNVAPLRTLRGSSTGLNQPQSVSYIPNNDTIQVINGDGSVVNFNRTASGNASPLN